MSKFYKIIMHDGKKELEYYSNEEKLAETMVSLNNCEVELISNWLDVVNYIEVNGVQIQKEEHFPLHFGVTDQNNKDFIIHGYASDNRYDIVELMQKETDFSDIEMMELVDQKLMSMFSIEQDYFILVYTDRKRLS